MGKKLRNWHIPFIALEIFQFDAQHVVLVVGQHVDVLVAQPKFSGRIAETVFVIGPISIEVLTRLTEIVATLNHLHEKCVQGISRIRFRVNNENKLGSAYERCVI